MADDAGGNSSEPTPNDAGRLAQIQTSPGSRMLLSESPVSTWSNTIFLLPVLVVPQVVEVSLWGAVVVPVTTTY